MHKHILKRCGIVLIIVGALDIANMIWSVSQGHSFSSSFNIFAVIGGVFLCRGSLEVARWIVMIATFMLSAFAGLLVVFPFIFPLGYWLAVFKQSPGSVAISSIVAAATIAVLYWLRRELRRPEVIQAQSEAGIPSVKNLRLIIFGGILPVAIFTMMTLMFHGDSAREAIRRAKEQVGGNYHCVVTSLQMHTSGQGKSVSAIVAAYNDSELKQVRISWKG